MRQVRMRHPSGLTNEVPETSVGQHQLAGWEVDPDEQPARCHACGQDLPAKSPPPPTPEASTAPAKTGASSSPAPKGRPGSSKEK